MNYFIAESSNTLYDIEIFSELVSKITEKIMPQISEWQNRGLESVYSFVFMDAIHYRIRENHQIVTKAAMPFWGSVWKAARKSWASRSEKMKAANSGLVS